MSKTSSYRRILLKLSGEAFMGSQKFGVDQISCLHIASLLQQMKEELGVEVGVVMGGGNFLRGLHAHSLGMERVAADEMGMLATIMNGLALSQALKKKGCSCRMMSAIPCGGMVELYSPKEALKAFDQEKLLLFVGGTGNPYFTTDTAAALRALEIQAEVLLKGTKVDGVYDKDPLKYTDGKKLEKVTYGEVLSKQLKIMDGAAVALCQESQLPICVFDLFEKDALRRVVLKENIGTFIT